MLGPFEVEFDPDAVVDYDNGNPTIDEQDCMTKFVEDIQNRGANVPHKELGDAFSVVEWCGYMIHIRYLNKTKTKVKIEKIYRPGIGKFRRI